MVKTSNGYMVNRKFGTKDVVSAGKSVLKKLKNDSEYKKIDKMMSEKTKKVFNGADSDGLREVLIKKGQNLGK
jgi:D-aminopeptidase